MKRAAYFSKIYPVFGLMAGTMLGSFSFLQYFTISSNTSDNGMRLNYPMCIGYISYVIIYHIYNSYQQSKIRDSLQAA